LLLACALLLAAPAMARTCAQVSASLMRPEQRSLRPMQWSPPPKLVALYFGADWCAPCHAFVPTLRSVRDALREAGADTEVVYVSLDERGRAAPLHARAGHAVAGAGPAPRRAHAGAAGPWLGWHRRTWC
jgi:thiol-disulfide isomerase/thioredoxin